MQIPSEVPVCDKELQMGLSPLYVFQLPHPKPAL